MKFQTVSREGVSKGWGVYEGKSGRELDGPGPNFAGRYTLIAFGCGGAGLTRLLDGGNSGFKNGKVYAPPPADPGMSHFGVACAISDTLSAVLFSWEADAITLHSCFRLSIA